MWRKTKKPEATDEEVEIEEDELPKATQKKPKQKTKMVTEVREEEYTLTPEEMELSIQTLLNTEEYKIYRQWLIGKKINDMVESYNP